MTATSRTIASERGERHRDEQARPQAPAVLGEHAERAERDRAERDHREVDDPVRPVDEDEAGGDRAVREAHDGAGHHHLLRDVPAVDVDHRPVDPPGASLPEPSARELYVGALLSDWPSRVTLPTAALQSTRLEGGS